jgi:CPA1 family monovalent cation:H+ antiporter
MVEFLLNGFVFILIGLELPGAVRGLSGSAIGRLIMDALVLGLSVIVIRILWVFPATYLPRLLFAHIRARDPYPRWQQVSIVAWTGMRGVVSMAAALALPVTALNDQPFPGRELILFLTFAVILATLVGQGLSLPWLIRVLGVEDDRGAEREEHRARLDANRAALARLDKIAAGDPTYEDVRRRLRVEYEDRIRQLEAYDPNTARSRHGLFSAEYERLSAEALRVEREVILRLRNQSIINDEVLRRIQRDIDLAEARIQHRRES